MKANADQRTVAAKEKVIALFHRAYKTCAAYRHFIDQSQLTPAEITSAADLEKIPITDKKNYIRKYSVTERLIDNRELADSYMITASSGSTGEPTFWPRDYKTDEYLETKKEELYEQHFQISKKRTLCINTFALGIWTAGMLTSRLSWGAAKRHKLTVMSTGTHKQSIYIAITNLGTHYDQIIILGYPPFLIELIEYLIGEGIDLLALNIKIMYTSDSLSSRAREFLLNKISSSLDPKSIVGFYAASDTGIIAAQSPLTVRVVDCQVKNMFEGNKAVGAAGMPVLFSFDPQVKFLETINNEVIITSDQPVPLIRYNIHDRGGVISGTKLSQILKKNEISFNKDELDDWYVYILGKTDSVLLTANVYVEDIRYCIERSTFFNKLNGSFKYGVEELKSLHKRLVVKIFLKRNEQISARDKKIFKDEFTKNLFTINTDLQAVKSDAFRPIRFIFSKETGDKYEGFKMKYFL